MSASAHAKNDDAVLRPHDLLWVADQKALITPEPLPSWATADWIARAPVVVRREKVDDPRLVAVGLRGKTRSQRVKAYLHRHAVVRCVKPEMLVRQAVWRKQEHLARFPAVLALAALAPALAATGLSWGPTGGIGFALASGLPVLHEDSDLDLMVRAEQPLTPAQTQSLRMMCAGLACRVDIQIDTGHGGFSFAEWAGGAGRVLLKTDIGPFLTSDPWSQDGPPGTAGACSR